ncbi:MarR family winged helix-turn-helix transcriptional regulator [Caldinitratiruptor microaerophilus]|uniref:HTH marR-type domain-containing protein n=1 Tax=Caldinitratiruptor microaerophilus TaxID=671077 RepID=A0AA35CN89_9FIRM|nr:MarR family winged helix-turn-helix transcriptional regulator [Caldinitratiruptor microaerophilus]BDG61599.1 hypothetical protein caldi_26890 [Caldinitratiruptor microaerophilus]
MSTYAEEIVDLLREVNRLVRERMARFLQEQGLPHSPSWAPVVRHVAMCPGVTVNELSRRLGMAKSHVSILAEQLQGEGILRKEPDPHDQRLVRLFLTDEGARLRGRWQETYRAFLAATVRSLPEDRAEHLLDGLRALRAALSAERQGGAGAEREGGGAG